MLSTIFGSIHKEEYLNQGLIFFIKKMDVIFKRREVNMNDAMTQSKTSKSPFENLDFQDQSSKWWLRNENDEFEA